MSDTEYRGLHYQTGQPLRIGVREGRVTQIESCDDGAAAKPGLWIAPGLFDIQVNGYGGVDFQQDDITAADLLKAVEALRGDACTRFFYTLITAEWAVLLRRLRQARQVRSAHAELQHAIAGWHIEGPFLSDKPGFCGAHDPGAMLDPRPEHLRELRAAAGEDRLMITIAPERKGAIEAIRLAVGLGITVSLGHTDAPSEVLRAAAAAGATGFTHLGNGCPRELDRHDNIVWRVCDMGLLIPSYIPDGIHVSPAPFRLMHRLGAERGWLYTTDAMSAAGAPPGRYRIGRLEVEVGADQVVRQPGKTNFAGSALRPIQGPFRAAKMLGKPWQECWRAMSEAPARFVGARNEVLPGEATDVCVLEIGPEGDMRSAVAFVAAPAADNAPR